MEIQLQPPFSSKWKRGYKVHDSSTGRFRVVLYNTQEDISGMSFARYLYSVYLGYEVPDEYEVDHINDICTDDRIENLQLLTKEQNRLKQEYMYYMFQQINYIVTCNCCDLSFMITEREMKMKMAKKLEYMFCSRSCAARFHHRKGHIPELLFSYGV